MNSLLNLFKRFRYLFIGLLVIIAVSMIPLGRARLTGTNYFARTGTQSIPIHLGINHVQVMGPLIDKRITIFSFTFLPTTIHLSEKDNTLSAQKVAENYYMNDNIKNFNIEKCRIFAYEYLVCLFGQGGSYPVILQYKDNQWNEVVEISTISNSSANEYYKILQHESSQ